MDYRYHLISLAPTLWNGQRHNALHHALVMASDFQGCSRYPSPALPFSDNPEARDEQGLWAPNAPLHA